MTYQRANVWYIGIEELFRQFYRNNDEIESDIPDLENHIGKDIFWNHFNKSFKDRFPQMKRGDIIKYLTDEEVDNRYDGTFLYDGKQIVQPGEIPDEYGSVPEEFRVNQNTFHPKYWKNHLAEGFWVSKSLMKILYKNFVWKSLDEIPRYVLLPNGKSKHEVILYAYQAETILGGQHFTMAIHDMHHIMDELPPVLMDKKKFMKCFCTNSPDLLEMSKKYQFFVNV